MTAKNSKGNASLFAPAFRLGVRCLCLRNGKLLLLRHFSPMTQKDFWALPGGLVSKGETIIDAAQRELLEETGLHGKPNGVVALQEFRQAALLEVVVVFSALRGRAKLGFDPEQLSTMPKRLRELRWFSPSETPPFQPLALRSDLISQFHQLGRINLPYSLTCD